MAQSEPAGAADRPELEVPPRHWPQDGAHVVLEFDDNRLASALFGEYGRNLSLIERRLGVTADSRGNHVTIAGPQESCEQTRQVLDQLYELLRTGHDLTQGDVEGAIRLVTAQGSLFEDEAAGRLASAEIRCASAWCGRAPRCRTPISAR